MGPDNTTEKGMDQNAYKYDVAFSFLSQDEALATELNDLLQNRLKTFLYSKRQGEIAGTDGEETFNKVFGEESRVVVVLYRLDWGETPWTRIEKTAIRNRAYEHGYNFVLFIPLDEPPTPPKWLPKTRLWIGLKRWGPKGAASVIEARVQEQGGELHEETVQEAAARLEHSIKFAKRREKFLHSYEGVRAANQEFESLNKEIQHLIHEIRNSINLDIKQMDNQLVILGMGLGLSLEWRPRYTNTLDNAKLNIQIWDDHPPFPGIINLDAKKIEEINFQFDLSPPDFNIWKDLTTDINYDTKNLASFILKHFMGKGL